MYEANLFYRFRQLIGGFRMDVPPVVADGGPATARFSAASELYVIIGAIAPGVVFQVEGTQADGATPPTANPVQIGAVSDDVLAAVADNVVVHFVTDLYRRLRTIPEGKYADGAADTVPLNPLKMGAVADAVLAAVADGQMASLVTDLYRRLYVNPQGGVADNVADDATNPVKIGAVALAPLAAVLTGVRAQLVTDLYRRLYVNPQGGVADDAVDDGTNPVKIGAVADQVPSSVADGDRAQLITDLERFLRIVSKAYDSVAAADRVSSNTIADDRDNSAQVWAADTNVAATTTYYPSSAGYEIGNRDHVTAQLVMSDNTTSLQASNDATTWFDITVMAIDMVTGQDLNASFATGAGASVNWMLDLERINARYIRFATVTPDATNAASIQVMTRKA
jgi:hypothetical protein